MSGPPRPLLPLPVAFLPPFMNPLPAAAAVVGPAPPNPNLHPIGLAFPIPGPPRPPLAPHVVQQRLNLLGMPPHPFAADDPAATRRNSAVEEIGDLDSKEEEEDYDVHRFSAPMGCRRDSGSSSSSSSSSDSDRMGKGSQLKF